jgi:threonine/homoserine/homoserine lactone efflux protein
MTGPMLFYFLCASMALTISPGPDNIFVMTQGIAHGRKPAIIAALGMCSGVSVHTMMAAFGISAVFYSSVIAFNVIKYAGAAYLLYLAWKTLTGRSAIQLGQAIELPAGAMFKRGFIMNVLNPKVAMFFLAFLPQFVTPGSDHIPVQMLLLGFVFMLQAIVNMCLIGYFAGSIGSFIQARPKAAKYLDWLTAGVLTSLGIRLALMDR